MGLVEVVRAMLAEVAVESGLSEQQLRRSTGFIIGMLSLEQRNALGIWVSHPDAF